jgi:hypothetical protein
VFKTSAPAERNVSGKRTQVRFAPLERGGIVWSLRVSIDITSLRDGGTGIGKNLGVAARFADDSFKVGTIKLPGSDVFCLFNWNNAPQRISFHLPRASVVTDFWSGERLGRHAGKFAIDQMLPHSARLLVCGDE